MEKRTMAKLWLNQNVAVLGLRNSGAKYISNENAEAISKFFSLLWQCVCKKTGQDSVETFAHYEGDAFGMPWHFPKGYYLFF